jgi:glycosyltransferase Alg8
MLSGDDKSTWYWLAANERRMLYVPDAMVTTYEVIPGWGVHRALANIRRWSGNSVRHSWRALKLGPKKLGWFPWYCLLDQRLTMVTVLFGPMVATLAALAGRWEMVAGYFLWILCSRISHAAISWRQGRRFSAFYVPLQILSDWTTALTKLWVVFHPAKQNWLNRGKRTLNTTQGSAFYGMRTGFAHYLYVFSCAAVLIGVGCIIGLLPVARDARLFLRPSQTASKKVLSVQNAPPASPAMLGVVSVISTPVSVDDEAGSKMLWPRPWMAFKSESRDAENNNKRVEPLLHEQSRQQ